jgi:hypothetical protein
LIILNAFPSLRIDRLIISSCRPKKLLAETLRRYRFRPPLWTWPPRR